MLSDFLILVSPFSINSEITSKLTLIKRTKTPLLLEVSEWSEKRFIVAIKSNWIQQHKGKPSDFCCLPPLGLLSYTPSPVKWLQLVPPFVRCSGIAAAT